MSIVCNLIDKDILFDCNNLLIGGVDDEAILINKADIVGYTEDPNNPLVVTNIVLASAGAGVKYQGFNNSWEAMFELVKKKYSNLYKHDTKFKIFTNDPTTKLQLYKLVHSKVVLIHKNNNKGVGGNAAFEIYGLDSGLIVPVHKRELFNTDTQGAHDLELSSDEAALEQYPIRTFFDGHYASTLAKINALT